VPVEMAPAAPPKRAATPRQTAVQARKETQSQTTTRAQAVNSVFQITALGLTARGMYADAGAISIHGPKISGELAALAETNSGVASFVDYLTSAGPYTGLFLAVMPLVFQIAANHGRVDATKVSLPGIMEPAELEKKVRKDIEEAKRQMSIEADES
jgi:hypothetical protein